ncbi:hypothetical protein [Kitasatospora azatica]|uniref:hypothetical protein n=1 Tax=Kitasatospora azatica TaxID=58347 RepID=UPI00056889C9|nr:hypothetical protein [Kitasatospora azatica]
MTELIGQEALFTPTTPDETPGAVPYQAASIVAFDAAVAGDGYGWLARLLPPPAPLPCPRCRRPMRLPAVPLLWQCTSCDIPQ